MSELDLARANFRVVLVLDQNHKEAKQQMVELDQLEKANSAKPSATSSKGDSKVSSKLESRDKAKSSATCTGTKNPYKGMFDKMAKTDSKVNHLTLIIYMLTHYVSSMAIILLRGIF